VHAQKPNDSSSFILAYNIVYHSFARVGTHSSQCAILAAALTTPRNIFSYFWTIFFCNTRL